MNSVFNFLRGGDSFDITGDDVEVDDELNGDPSLFSIVLPVAAFSSSSLPTRAEATTTAADALAATSEVLPCQDNCEQLPFIATSVRIACIEGGNGD